MSGLIMLGYLLVHMYGNLKFFQGREKFDHYLHETLPHMFYPYLPEGGAMWIIRVLLVAALLVHAYAAATLWRRNKAAAGYVGGKRYHTSQNKTGYQRSYASFTMRWGGVILLLFIIGHVAQMMPNWISPGGASDSKYDRVVNGFGCGGSSCCTRSALSPSASTWLTDSGARSRPWVRTAARPARARAGP
ncbi:succinate dehydrogenase [Aeromicrobium sp. UC242_57]|uniref:succinate dehydrogenase n=1 Tax=Aeromicrobium sp. UC242_57 TaxID=3374624 RepID=UPI003793A701